MNDGSTQTTQDRILDASLRLFNELGYSRVPIIRIATQLGISSGHIGYHFKSKDEIVLALFPRLEAELHQDIWGATSPGHHMTPLEGTVQQIEVFRSIWRYRFVFNALTQLMAPESKVRARFIILQDRIMGSISRLFDEMIRLGDMRPIPPPNSTQVIARALWMLYLSWLRFEQIETPTREEPRNASILAGIMHNFSVLQAHLYHDFSDEMQAELLRLLPPDEVTPIADRRERAGLA